MGAKACKIEIQLEQQEVTAGDVLKGRVAAEFARGKNVPPTTLTLVFLGREIAKIKHKEDALSTRDHHYDARTQVTRRICSVEVNLVQQADWYHGEVEAFKEGRTYIYPFEIPTSADLPSSFLVSKSKKKFCAIEYSLSVTAIPQGQKPFEGLGKITIPLSAAPAPNEIVPVTITPDALKVQAEDAYQSFVGTFGAAARVADVHVSRGHKLEIFLACINDAEVKIDKVRMAFVQRAYWSTVGLKRKTITELDLAVIDNIHLPGVERNPTEAKSSKEALLKLLESPANRITMEIPYGCLDSYVRGKVVNIRHFVKVTFCTRTGVSNPFFLIPITVVRMQPLQPQRMNTSMPQSALPTPMEPPQDETATADFEPLYQYEDYPVVLADYVIPADAFVAPTTSVRLDATRFGGLAVDNTGDTEVQAMTPPPHNSSEVSMPLLLRELEESIQDYHLLLAKLEDPAWGRLLSQISPSDFSYIILLVDVEEDQPKVAQLLAQNLAQNGSFSCEHARAAIANVADWTRINTVQKLLPFCNDLSRNAYKIRSVLTEWELYLTRDAFASSVC